MTNPNQAIIFDTETTDATDGQLIEAAYVPISFAAAGRLAQLERSFQQRYRPSNPISYGAMATHHILDADLVDMPLHNTFALPDGVEYLIGHSIDFDWNVIGAPAHVKRICTLAIARKLWPNTSHTLGALMYMLSSNHARTREDLRNAHSALADVFFCWALLDEIVSTIGCSTMEELHEFSEECRVPDVIPFGKHKGTKIADLPHDYVGWLIRQPDVDPYLMKALRDARGLR
jgi:exodeoxyribonuclease X